MLIVAAGANQDFDESAVAVKVALGDAGVTIPFPQRVLSFASQLEDSSASRVRE